MSVIGYSQKKRYDVVMKELKLRNTLKNRKYLVEHGALRGIVFDYPQPQCGDKCKYAQCLVGLSVNLPTTETCDKLCTLCARYKVAGEKFRTCHRCATVSRHPREYVYYHLVCGDYKAMSLVRRRDRTTLQY